MEKYVSKLFNSWANNLVLFSQRYGRQGWLTFLFILTLTMMMTFPSIGNSQDTLNLPKDNFNHSSITQDTQACSIKDISRELRGVWLTNIDSDVLFSRQKLHNAISTLAEVNFNTLYPTVWNWGYTLYPSAVAKEVTGKVIDPAEGLQGRDILPSLCDKQIWCFVRHKHIHMRVFITN